MRTGIASIGLLALGAFIGSLACATGSTRAVAAEEPEVTVEKLLAEGWTIAGFTGAGIGRSFILFSHKERGYLSQCSVLYDVTRAQRVQTNCYEVR